MNRSRASHDLLTKHTREKCIDIVIGQEPNKKSSNIDFWDSDMDCFINIYKHKNILNTIRGSGFVFVELPEFVVGSCYFSPNSDLESFNTLINNMDNVFQTTNKDIILGGDLNAKSNIFGSVDTNPRGGILEDWISSRGLIVINTGNTPTFSGAQGTSLIDFTVATTNVSKKLNNWTVLEDYENLSDHHTITFQISVNLPEPAIGGLPGASWVVPQKRLKVFQETVCTLLNNTSWVGPEVFVSILKEACDKCFYKNRSRHPHLPVYWWNDIISEKRKKCVKVRRTLTRLRTRTNISDDMVKEAKENLKQARKDLQREIRKSKSQRWADLCKELDDDVWGKAYQIVVERLRLRKVNTLPKEIVDEQVKKLFPVDTKVAYHCNPTTLVPPFTVSELNEALGRLKPRKAPGPDMLTPEILLSCVKSNQETVLNIYNDCLATSVFPKIWKTARLILIEKPNKHQSLPVSYRPICLLDSAGKLLEILIRDRLEKEIQEKKLLHKNQFGFVKGCSTMSALERVTEISSDIRQKSLRHRELAVMVFLDIENAFNSARWSNIIRALERKNVSGYLVNILRSYLRDRWIVTQHGDQFEVTCGVPQGSILGPTLWNIFYDEVLEMETETGVELIAYADDLAIIVRAKSRAELEDKTTYVTDKVVERLSRMDLKVASGKTQLLIMEGRSTMTAYNLLVGESEIASETSVKYLGVYLDKDLKLTCHVKQMVLKANKTINALMRIMPKIGGPKASKRRLLMSTVLSTILYAAPVWAKALKHKKYQKMLETVNRRLAIGVTSAYRTISSAAVQAVAGVPPIELLVKEREEIHKNGKMFKAEARKNLFTSWQQKWHEYQGWAKFFIKDVEAWANRSFGETDFYLTQAFSGHGCFGTYLYKIKKAIDNKCWYCGMVDDPEHTLFVCQEFEAIRSDAIKKCPIINKNNIADVILRDEASWNCVTDMFRKIMTKKAVDEKERQSLVKTQPIVF